MMRMMLIAGLLVGTASSALAQSSRSVNAPPPPPLPPLVASQPARPAPDMQAVLDQLPALGAKPIERLTPVKARIQPSAADAARAEMRRRGMSTAPDPAVTTQDMPYGSDPMQFARIYKPAVSSGGGARLPVIVYYHGGGWVIADVNTYDATPRLLSKQLGAIVVSVEYRHAPEFKFPAQHDDAAAAYRWSLQNAASWGGACPG
jgi:acetyl esterase/lipase